MKSVVTTILSLFFLTQCGCAFDSVSTSVSSAGPQNSNSQFEKKEKERQTVRWEKQGITFTLPPDWHKDESLSRDDEKRNETFSISSLVWRGPGDQRIEFNIETGEKDFPVSEREMLEKDYESNKEENTFKDVHYQEIGGVKGLYARLAGDEKRINASWLTYRHHNGKAQSIGVNLVGPSNEMELLMTILNSLKLEHDRN